MFKCDSRLLKVSGIYKITNLINGKFYVGSSSNVRHRLYEHLSKLRRQIHSNQHLQHSFSLYGESQHHSEETKKLMSEAKKKAYLGKNNPNFGNKWTEEQKQRMSATHKALMEAKRGNK